MNSSPQPCRYKLFGGSLCYQCITLCGAGQEKYTYDDVPNYSAPTTMRFSVDEAIPVVDDENYETQEEEEHRLSGLERNDLSVEPID
ncbi:hypothetical protein [Sansalvadorimonas verongulae]|uniref:hypothetical protein n=1 Tax=Sansalvadorimonas verongulae TaxID=2172824 RepID=UPI0012BCEFB0|nr:hypothetical protein [Sansalvadorimonas verongulae]MTI13613.1 hypothetical protein [Sansalvadorimonas verongulae]